jgi:hypothetical protein
MQVINKINRALPNKPTNIKERNGILINGFRFVDDIMDCGIGANINAYQYNYPDQPKVYRFISAKPNFIFLIQNRKQIDVNENNEPIWGEIEWVTPIIKWRPLDISKTNTIFPPSHPFIKEWLNIKYLNEVYWIPPNTEFKVDPETGFIVGRKLIQNESGEIVFESLEWSVMDYRRPHY